jgi:hypothetical protein
MSIQTHHTTAAEDSHGLVPPAFDPSVHKLRCFAQLHSKDKDIEKYIYLSHLKDSDPSMFYTLILEHMSVRTQNTAQSACSIEGFFL